MSQYAAPSHVAAQIPGLVSVCFLQRSVLAMGSGKRVDTRSAVISYFFGTLCGCDNTNDLL
jgi:hypothetical protein